MTDRCCHLCRSHTGICLTRFQCDHHQAFADQEERDHRARRTYLDTTADQAIANADRDLQRRRKEQA